MANMQEASTVGDVARNIPRINATLEDLQVDYQPMMIELEGKLILQPVSILVDPGAILSYVNHKIVELCALQSYKFKKSMAGTASHWGKEKSLCQSSKLYTGNWKPTVKC